MFRVLFLLATGIVYFQSFSQNDLNNYFDYSNPQEYEIGGITVSGVKYLDHAVLISTSGLKVGEKILVPGEEVSAAIEKLWKLELFSDIKIKATKIVENIIFLDIYLQERPRLSKFNFEGVSKSEADDLREKLKLIRGSQVTEDLLLISETKTKDFFIDKGFLNTEVIIQQETDTGLVNHVILNIKVDKKTKVKIHEIAFEGNEIIKDKKLRRAMKETKQKTWYNVFKASKFIEKNYRDDKQKIIEKYNSKGFRDAKIIHDTLYKYNTKTISLRIRIDEGKKYYFRNITWVGNTKYSSKYLSAILGIKKGDVFDQALLDEKLITDQEGVSSVYQDNGYLFSSITPVEILVENDSIDIEMVVVEGKQAYIGKVTISGNERTNDHVIRREIRTMPGELYKRSDLIRTYRELGQLPYFNPEKINIIPIPNPQEGTVDLEYTVEERPSDQVELSGGWGAGMLVGTLGLSFNNFSARNILKKQAWSPLPSGDGQRLSIRAQTNGTYYQAYNMSFVEPWLGGKKPNSLSVSLYHTIQTSGNVITETGGQSMKITGVSVGLGRRLPWPDDFFTLYNEISYQIYHLDNWNYFIFNNGNSNNVSLTTTLGRNSSGPSFIFPTMGSDFSLSVQATLPYSLFNGKDYKTIPDYEKYKWIEYHKYVFRSSVFTSIIGKFVLNTRIQLGLLCFYNREIGPSPFEGYDVGGDGLSGFSYYGTEKISLRGYTNSSLTPSKYIGGREIKAANIYNKYTLEFRYPVSLNPNATIYALAFAEGGNAWYEARSFNPFDIKRSAGIGVRIFLPMLGMLGVDWGYGFDNVYDRYAREIPGVNKSQFHFVIGYPFN